MRAISKVLTVLFAILTFSVAFGLAPTAAVAQTPGLTATQRTDPVIANLPGVYNLKFSNNRNFIAGLRAWKAGAAQLPIAVYGDSTIFGYESEGVNSFTNNRLDSVPYQLAGQLTTAGLSASSQNLWGAGGNITAFTDLLTADSRVTMTGTGWINGSIPSPGGGIIWNVVGSDFTSTITFTTNATVDTVEITTIANGAGDTAEYSIDGVATGTITGSGVPAWKKTTISLGSPGTHALKIRKTGGSFYIIGENFYDSTSPKLLIWNWGINSGDPTGTLGWNKTTNPYDVGNQHQFNGQRLSIINCVENPMGTATAAYVTTTMNSLQQMITALKANGSDVWLVMPQPITNSAPQAEYIAALMQLAKVNNLTFINLSSKYTILSDWQAAAGGTLSTDAKHPTTAGYAVNAARLRDVILAVAKTVVPGLSFFLMPAWAGPPLRRRRPANDNLAARAEAA